MDNQILLSDGNQTDSKDFQCPICQKYFSRKFTLDMHLLIHKGIKPHPCPFCGKCFRQKGTLMRHKALHSTNNLFHCSLCNRGFRQKNVFLHHLKHRHNVSTETLDRRKYRTQLKDYQSIMDTLPPFVLADSTAIASSEKHLDAMLFETLSNNICDSSISEGLLNSDQSNCFDNQIELSVDNLEHHTQDSVATNLTGTSGNHLYEKISYKCDICLKVFFDYDKYKQHIKQQHNNAEMLLDSKPIICDLPSESSQIALNSCDLSNRKVSPSDTNLTSPTSEKRILFKNRTNTVSSSNDLGSNGQMNFCLPCQMSFVNEEEFNFHLKTHVQSVLAESQESSPEKSSNDLKLTNSGSTATNSYCDILSGDNSSSHNLPSLLSTSTLAYLHQKSKVSKQKIYEKQGNIALDSVSHKFHYALYKCNLCSKMFQNKLTFEYHNQLHLSTRGFDCGYCKRRFATKQLLLSHTRSKHLKIFKCSSCFRSFNYRSIYDYHKKNCNNKINAGKGLQSLFNLPLIDIQKLLNSDVTGIAGIIPICDTSISKNSTFNIGIPVVSIEGMRELSKIPFLSSLEINGALKGDVT